MTTQQDGGEDGGAGGDLTAARMRALLMRSPTAIAFVRNGRFEVVSEVFSTSFGHGDETDLDQLP